MGYDIIMDIMKYIQSELRKTKDGIRQIARATDIDPTTVCRAKQGRAVDVKAAGKLLAYFGYRIVKSKG